MDLARAIILSLSEIMSRLLLNLLQKHRSHFTALVVSPLLALSRDQRSDLRRRGISACMIGLNDDVKGMYQNCNMLLQYAIVNIVKISLRAFRCHVGDDFQQCCTLVC